MTLEEKLLQIAPAVLQLIFTIESLFKAIPKSGSIKKSIVLAAVPSILQATTSPFIDVAVTAINTAQAAVGQKLAQ